MIEQGPNKATSRGSFKGILYLPFYSTLSCYLTILQPQGSKLQSLGSKLLGVFGLNVHVNVLQEKPSIPRNVDREQTGNR